MATAVSSEGDARSKVTSRPLLVSPNVSPDVTPMPGGGVLVPLPPKAMKSSQPASSVASDTPASSPNSIRNVRMESPLSGFRYRSAFLGADSHPFFLTTRTARTQIQMMKFVLPNGAKPHAHRAGARAGRWCYLPHVV